MNFEYPEGATPLDPDEARGLLLTHITSRGELDRWEQENIAEADAWAFRRTPRDILTDGFIKRLHARVGEGITLVTPGVRMPADAAGDQKRVVTPAEAIRRGADYLVVGRPITKAADPAAAARAIAASMRGVFPEGEA